MTSTRSASGQMPMSWCSAYTPVASEQQTSRRAPPTASRLVEATTSVVVGAVLTQIGVSPLFGLAVSVQDNLVISSIFTAVSIGRSYTARRVFEAIALRRSSP